MAGFGLRLGRSQGMEGYTGNLNEFLIDPTNANAIFTGDPVVLNGGYIEAEATGTAPLLGVFFGCRYVDVDGDYEFRNFWDGNTGRSNIVAHVALPTHQMFHAKMAAPGSIADVGTRRALTAASGSTQYGDSRYLIGAVNASGPVQIHRLANLPGNDWANAEPIVECSIVLQQGTASDAA